MAAVASFGPLTPGTPGEPAPRPGLPRVQNPSFEPSANDQKTARPGARERCIVLSNRGGPAPPQDLDRYVASGGYAALRKALLEMTPLEVVELLEKSRLRGRGGAGFPVGRKWRACRDAPGSVRFVVCNAEEGEPGTFKDRLILESDPHRVLEGLAVACYAVGAETGYVYVRHDLAEAASQLEDALHAALDRGFLGDNVLGSGVRIRLKLFLGGGAYVCGEELGLIASMEGRRPCPAARPPYPTQAGLWDLPTVVNNVETLATVPAVFALGADWYRDTGGTKVFCVTGDCLLPGAYELPLGTSLRELIYSFAGGLPRGEELGFIQVGGTAGACLDPELVDVALEFDALGAVGASLGTGSVFVGAKSRCPVRFVRERTEFFASQSCGKCTPCRIGVTRILELLRSVEEGRASREAKVLGLLGELCESVRALSLCGLGQAAPGTVMSGINRFAEEFEAHAGGRGCTFAPK
ncbi:MAG: SLBB domain-containing protein [Firmicutes bacterium]|nr:SLBB domain-containing protein [Bacillota bacterium]